MPALITVAQSSPGSLPHKKSMAHVYILGCEIVHDDPLSCHLATLIQWPVLGPQNSAIARMHPAVLTALHINPLACHLMAVFLAQDSTSSQSSRVSKNQRLNSDLLLSLSSPMLTPGPYLAFSHIQDSNLVSVIGWNLVKQLY